MLNKTKIKCKKCGRCCKVMYLWLGGKPEADYRRWINLHEKIKVVKRGRDYGVRIELKCTKLKNNSCTIYKNRPDICKEYSCKEMPNTL